MNRLNQLNSFGHINGAGKSSLNWKPQIPTGLTLTLISGGVKYDWTDNTGGTAQTEIWCRSDSGAYTTATYTINAGTVTKSETLTPVDLRYCKIRTKDGVTYSAFTAEQSIAMLGAELADQANWYKLAWWTNIGAGWSQVDTHLHDTAGSVVLKIQNFWSAGKTYRINTTIVKTSGNLYLYDGTSLPDISGSGLHSVVMIPSITYFEFYVNVFTGDVTTLSIKEILMP